MAVEGLKGLVKEIQILHVPDEAAAIEAARAWCANEPPAGRPYDVGVVCMDNHRNSAKVLNSFALKAY